jgi:hypothetical protein
LGRTRKCGDDGCLTNAQKIVGPPAFNDVSVPPWVLLVDHGQTGTYERKIPISELPTIRQPERTPCRHGTVRKLAGYTRQELGRRGDR